MTKVPGARADLAAIKTLLAEGVHVNITLLFGLNRYREVAEAFLAGLEARAAAGKSLDWIASVASFFLSRIDTRVDSKLDALGTPQTNRCGAALPSPQHNSLTLYIAVDHQRTLAATGAARIPRTSRHSSDRRP